jgi:hypothetical protein
MADKSKTGSAKDESKKPDKTKSMNELRKLGISNLPPTDDAEFNIASPNLHVPEGQNTHE